MRICLVTPGFSAGADDWCIPALRHLVERLVQTGCQVRVLAVRYPYRAGSYELSGAGVTAIGGAQRQNLRSLGVWRGAIAVLAREHRRQPFDVLHAFWAGESGALAGLAGRLLGIPTLVSLAGGELARLPEIGYGGQLAFTERLKIQLTLRLADAISAGSCDLLQRAAPRLRGRPAGDVLRIPLGVDLDLFSPGAGQPAPPDPPRVVHVGSLIPVKDQATLLRAAALVRDGGQDFVLDIVGEGPQTQSLAALAGQLDLSRVVRWHGSIPHPLLPAVYRAGAVFVSTSRYEAQSMVVLEAAGCGLPVVGTRVGVVPELAPEGAIVAPVGDAAALASGLAQVLTDPRRRDAMGRAARLQAEREYGLERCADRFSEVYAGLAGHRKGRVLQ